MKSVKEVANSATVLRELTDYCKNVQGSITPPTALDMLFMLKRAETYIEEARKSLLGAANREFISMQELNPRSKQIIIAEGRALLRPYTPRSTWQYSAELQDSMDKLKVKQEYEQEQKIAKKIKPKQDIDVNPLFSMSINEKTG